MGTTMMLGFRSNDFGRVKSREKLMGRSRSERADEFRVPKESSESHDDEV